MILTPLPGTPVYEKLRDEGRLISQDWSYYDAHHVVFEPKGMSVLQLQKLTLKSMLKFYSFMQILNRLNRFDLWTMAIRAYGWRAIRQSRRNMRGFMKQLKELYEHSGSNLSQAKRDIQFRARRTSDDLRELLGRINFDRIREMKQERIDRWRSQAGANR